MLSANAGGQQRRSAASSREKQPSKGGERFWPDCETLAGLKLGQLFACTADRRTKNKMQ